MLVSRVAARSVWWQKIDVYDAEGAPYITRPLAEGYKADHRVYLRAWMKPLERFYKTDQSLEMRCTSEEGMP